MATDSGHLGIDFGASTTFVASYRAGDSRILADAEGYELTPSVVAFTPTGAVRVGRAARSRRLIDPHNAIYSFKRIMGRRAFSVEAQEFRRTYPFVMVEAEDHTLRFATRAGELTAVEIATYLFAHLRAFPDVASMPGARVCVTVPAAFDEASRAAVVSAAAGGGFEDVVLVSEPEAAAAAYFGEGAGDQTVAVYDLGGGTFDLAVLRSRGPRIEVLAADGDPYLGGDDIDQALARWAADEILAAHRWDVRTSATAREVLLYVLEQAKIALSRVEETVVNLSRVDDPLADQSLTLTRAQLEQLSAGVIRRTFVACDATLSKAGVRPDDIDRVILIGGGSHIPALQEAVQNYFGSPPVVSTAPDRIVARGAALCAAGRAREVSPTLSESDRGTSPAADAPRVLVVDDEEMIRTIISRILELEGFVVDTASDGRLGLERMAGTRPDLVISDIRMPNATGFEMVEGMRSGDATRSIPVIFVTAYASAANRARSVSLDVDTLISKPFSADELLAAVNGLMGA